jgi:transposase-like protein
MPFTETCRMEERIRMLSDYETGNWSVSELCRRYGVCGDTFYEWRRRRGSGEENWFLDRSHAPLSCPHRTDVAVAEAITSLRRRFPYLGPHLQFDDTRGVESIRWGGCQAQLGRFAIARMRFAADSSLIVWAT